MKKKTFILLLACWSFTITHSLFGQNDPKMDAFIDGLMERMTLDEKLGQLNLASGGIPDMVGAAVGQDNGIRHGYLGATGGMDPNATKRAQEIAVNESRLGIPLLISLNVIHGYKTIFPIPLAISCCWDLKLIEKSARIAAEEASAYGINWFFPLWSILHVMPAGDAFQKDQEKTHGGEAKLRKPWSKDIKEMTFLPPIPLWLV